VDTSAAKRDLRADTMRRLGMEVDIAADISEARVWWRADLYNLVLINMEGDLGQHGKFCEDVRGAVPPQQLAFLVGKPTYLADAPIAEGAVSVAMVEGPAIPNGAGTALTTEAASGPSQRWGILEASRRISAVRSLSHARTKAIKERPAPARDLEKRYSNRLIAGADALAQIFKGEIQ
jgi:hypothetical protein